MSALVDSIEYELLNWEPRECWRCSACGRYRHRPAVKGLLPALCCNEPAKLVTSYKQPLLTSEAAELPDVVLDSVMAQMQAAALLFQDHRGLRGTEITRQ
jgi:hypothetical protein